MVAAGTPSEDTVVLLVVDTVPFAAVDIVLLHRTNSGVVEDLESSLLLADCNF